MTNRDYDTNGWFEIKNNPLSTVGVFQYGGATIGEDADPDRMYSVLRPAEELGSPECIESFRLLPWIDNHSMLGDEENGLTPAEQKGVQGVIGEDVSFDGTTLRANIKVFSQAMSNLIANGKKELSCGYRCRYEKSPGVFDGQPYDYVQRDIRGNHLALVNNGRMGPAVAVQDHLVFTIDQAEFQPMANEKEDTGSSAMTLEEAAKAIGEIMPIISKIQEMLGSSGAAPAADPVEDDDDMGMDADKKDDDMGVTKDADAKDADADKEDKEKAEDSKSGMDAAEIARRVEQNLATKGKLYAQLTPHIGTFDASEMSVDKMVRYGCKQLGISPPKGQHTTFLQAYLLGKGAPTRSAMDAAAPRAGNFIDRHIKGA